MRYVKPIAVAAALAIGASTLVGAAEAGHRNRHYHHRHNGDAAELAVIGIFGLAAGALLATALAQPAPPRYYYDPAYGQAPQPPVVYQNASAYPASAAAPWSQAWYDYCSRFPSFDPQTGYIYASDGTYQFCR